MAEEKNELKSKVNSLEYQVVQKDIEIKGLSNAMHVLYETERRLEAENEILRVTKREMFAESMNGSRSRHSGNLAKKIASTLREDFVGIGLQVESMFSKWCAMEFAELEHFEEGHVRKWTNRGDVVTEHGIVVGEGKMIAPLPPQLIATSGKFVVHSFTSEEDALRIMMEEQMKGKQWENLCKSDESRKPS